MNTQYSALLEGTSEPKYFKDLEGKFTFTSKENLIESLANDSRVTGAKIFKREVSDWKLDGEYCK